MARLLDDAATQYLQATGTPVTAAPFTMAAWARSNDATVTQTVMGITDIATSDGWRLNMRGATAGDPIGMLVQVGAGSGLANTTTGYTANTWHHVCGIEASSSDRRVFIDGGSKGTEATNLTPTAGNLDTTALGRSATLTPAFYFSGDIAEAAIWDVALTDAQVALLAKGASPLMVQPQNLVFYAPLIGKHASEIDIVGGLSLTVTGPTASAHPRVFYLPRFDTGAPVAAGSVIVTPTTATLSLSTFAPSIILGTVLTPTTASLTLSTFTPTVSVSDNQSVTPTTAALTLATFAPSVTATANQSVTPTTAILTLEAFAPTVSTGGNQSVTPTTVSLILSTFEPTVTVSANQVVTPTTASLVLTTFEPTVIAGGAVAATPTTASLTLSTFAPDVTTSDHQSVTPATVSLVLAALAPTVTATAHQTVTPGTASLVLVLFAPTVIGIALQRYHVGRGRYTARHEGAGRYTARLEGVGRYTERHEGVAKLDTEY